MTKRFANEIINKIRPILGIPFIRNGILLWHVTVNEKIKGSYSQKGEDLIIERILKTPKKGFYVDVGANNPIDCSNTARFFKKGWSGINIEPNPKNILLFKRKRPTDTNLGIGIASKKGVLNYYEFEEDMLSTFSEKEAEEYKKQGKRIVKKHRIRVEKLSTVLGKYTRSEIDFLSIDTEGFDMEVLKSNDWNKYRPKTICIESTSRGYGRDLSDEFDKYLSTRGYKKAAQTRLNTIYMREIK